MTKILMSIHHKYAQLIYSGEKTVELRKTTPTALDDEKLMVYLYETDLKSITGIIYVDFCREITEITPKIIENSCLSRKEIEAYKDRGRGKLYGWEIRGIDEYGPDWLLPEDLHVKKAPQSWQYIKEN
uniref:ASCH domain-containing protein n=1 Tax=uncultured Fibrobacter sp. TaxID=261512 RepID=UPI00260678B6|nr:ASCH domain-containing protein [uncultured Fibrobacter sp.]